MDLKKKTITVFEDDWTKLGELAQSYGLNRLQLVRMLIKAQINSQESIADIMAKLGQDDQKTA